LKEGAEDLKRHRSDYETNNLKKCIVVSKDGEQAIAWRDLKVGSIIKLTDKSEVGENHLSPFSYEANSFMYSQYL
jgi:phospholipid-transporting ATPase